MTDTNTTTATNGYYLVDPSENREFGPYATHTEAEKLKAAWGDFLKDSTIECRR